MEHYILNANGDPEPCGSLLEWARWFETSADVRRVALDNIGGVKVSTVFLGLDHSFDGAGPVLFETLVFGGPLDGEQERYATRDEAVTGHVSMVERVKGSVPSGGQ